MREDTSISLPAQPPTAAVTAGFAILAHSDPRPKIQLPGDGRLLSDFADDLGRALIDKDLWKRNGRAVVLNARKDGLQEMTPAMLRSWVEDHLVCFKVRRINASSLTVDYLRTMTTTDAAGVLSSPQFLAHLDEIERLNQVRAPVRREDGWIELLPAGYDYRSQTFTLENDVQLMESLPLSEGKRIIDELLNVCRATVARLEKRGLVTPLRIGPRLVRYSASELARLLKESN